MKYLLNVVFYIIDLQTPFAVIVGIQSSICAFFKRKKGV